MTVEYVRVGDVLELRRRAVEVDPSAEYREVGVRSFGRGIFHKEPIAGIDLGSKRVFRIEPGDLVISNVFAWEGAIAVASEAEEGMIGSHRFMTFRPKDDRADTAWLAWFFLSEPGLELIRRASPGSAGRNRTLAIERFENLEIRLPPIGEQRSVAARLDILRDRAAGADDWMAASEAQMQAFTEVVLLELADGLRSQYPKQVRLETLGEWSSGGTPKSDASEFYDGSIPWAVIGDLNDDVVSETRRTISELGLSSSSAKLVPKGTVLIGMYGSIGKLGLSGRPMTVNQAIACCTPHGGESAARFLLSFLRCIRQELVGLGKGGAQQNISQTILKSIEVPDLDAAAQATFVKKFQHVKMLVEDCQAEMLRRRAIVRSVVPAAMNEVLSSLK